MNGFSFPPPPPPPPPQPYNVQIPQSQSSRGSANSRGGRGRGRGPPFSRGGSQRGGYTQSRGVHAQSQGGSPLSPGVQDHNQSGYPLPSYPQWQPSSTAQPPFQTTTSPYQNTQPHYQPSHFQQIPQFPPAQSYNFPQHPSQAQPSPYQGQTNGQAHSPTHYYGHGTSQAQVPHSQPTSQTPLVTPPIRWDFGNRPQGKAQSKGQNHTSPNPFPGNKRKRDQSSRSSQSAQQSNNATGTSQKPQVAPAVPSFGFALPAKPPPPATSEGSSKKRKKRKHNQLGLTPNGDIHEDTDEDVDEEAAFVKSEGPIAITHGGQTLLLNSESDISAWLAERKKRFPTQANIAAKKAQAEALAQARREKDFERHAEAAKQKKHRDPTSSKSSRRKESNMKKNSNVKTESSAKPESAAPAESIPDDPLSRIAYLEEQLRLAKEAATHTAPVAEDAKEELLDTEAGAENASTVELETANVSHAAEIKPDLGLGYDSADSAQEVADGSDSSSVVSSDSSDDDSNAGPEEQSSKSDNPVRVPPPKRVAPKRQQEDAEGRPVCNFFMRSGFCKYKDKCKYSHQLPKDHRKPRGRPDKAAQEAAKPRQGLYEKLVQQEAREDATLGLKAIKYLGSTGFLD